MTLQGVNESLVACGVKPSNVFTTQVPGAFELPVTARLLAASKRVDVIVNLACIIEGETMRSQHVVNAVAKGLMQVR
jgi:6,7-dimethyl-8-ribityllumazine synthase